MGMEWTSRDPFDEELVSWSLVNLPCLPTWFPKIDGKGKGIGRGQRATDRWLNIGLVLAR
jgi:hypothetical protein